MPSWGSTWRRPTTARSCSPPPWHAWSAWTHRAWRRAGGRGRCRLRFQSRAPGGRRPGPDGAGPTARVDGRPTADPDPVAWYWIVHDDSAPQPDCLAALLRGADRNPAAAVLVPKTVAWSDPGRLVGVGNRWAPGTPVVDPLDPTERDQGQYDVDRAVYAGDSAGMLVRADLWHRLGGMDPNVGDWAAPADLCRRAWGAGAEVDLRPSAVLAHRQAGHRGVRAAPGRSATTTGTPERTRGARPGPAS